MKYITSLILLFLISIQTKAYFYDDVDLTLDVSSLYVLYTLKDNTPSDKYKHLVAGSLISYSAIKTGKYLFRKTEHRKLYSILFGVGMATLQEF